MYHLSCCNMPWGNKWHTNDWAQMLVLFLSIILCGIVGIWKVVDAWASEKSNCVCGMPSWCSTKIANNFTFTSDLWRPYYTSQVSRNEIRFKDSPEFSFQLTQIWELFTSVKDSQRFSFSTWLQDPQWVSQVNGWWRVNNKCSRSSEVLMAVRKSTLYWS